MAIAGTLIKAAIHLQQYIIPETEHAGEEQTKQLRSLLKKASDTSFGKFYGFENLLKSPNIKSDFVQKVPIHDYETISQRWWCRSLEGEKDICWPGRVQFFALSSGTTGNKSKRIPVTQDMLKSIQKTSLQQILSLTHYNLPVDFYEKDILLVGSSTSLSDKGVYKEGEISGISAYNIPEWFNNYYKPGNDIAGISNWEEKVDAIIKKAPEWDIGAMAGIPAWYQVMMQRIIDYYGLETIHDIWPNLQVYASGGVAFEPYRKNFDKLFGKPVHVTDTYLASEGYLAFQCRPDTNAMKLNLDAGIYYEFVPFTEHNFDSEGKIKPNPEIHLLEEVEENCDYAIVISTCSGAWRYLIGDTIRFTNKARHEIIITGRTKHFLNVAGSQLSIEKLNAGINHLQETFDIKIADFLVSAIEYQEGFAHKWYIGSNDPADNQLLKNSLDHYLKEINKNYKGAREKALKDVFVEIVPPDFFYQYHVKYKTAGGQSKTPRVMKKEQFQQFEALVETLSQTQR
ncbi:GH3 auxin-responsive promoter family protein [Cytophagaceae bacterium ABcell3]|nr:GH3 auxin-responsive promoter family protein [Cytophagaceae bacterium ABcell3]